MPYEDFRVEQLVHTLNDARDHFQSNGGRIVASFWIAYLDVHVLAVFKDDCTLIAMHIRPEEADFLAGAAKSFLNDAQLLVAAALGSASGEQAPGDDDEDNWLPQPPRLDPNQTNVVV